MGAIDSTNLRLLLLTGSLCLCMLHLLSCMSLGAAIGGWIMLFPKDKVLAVAAVHTRWYLHVKQPICCHQAALICLLRGLPGY